MSRPASKFVSPLSDNDRQFLEHLWHADSSPRVRHRAHAILLSAEGYTVADLQDIFHITKPTALGWINRWEEHGREGLRDKPRPGAPPMLTERERKTILKPLIERFPRRPKLVLRELKRKTGKTISRTTLRRMCRKLGLTWKRYRRSSKKHRDEGAFQRATREIAELRSDPNLQLAYFDEAGFSLQGIVPYGWQTIGTRTDLPVGASRDAIQVLGIQEEAGLTHGYLHKGKVYGTTVRDVIDDYSRRITGPTLLILDNASVHRCKLIKTEMEATWWDRGLYLYYLPTYCPQLNNIERFWKLLKYTLLPIDSWETLSSLSQSLISELDKRGDVHVMPSLQNI